MKDSLRDEKCRECQKSIRVSPVMPYEGDEEETGCAASYPGEFGDDEFCGWICFDCAFAAAMRTVDDDGVRGMLGGGAGGWDFTYC